MKLLNMQECHRWYTEWSLAITKTQVLKVATFRFV